MKRIAAKEEIFTRLQNLLAELLRHPGYGQLDISVRLLRDAHKEVIVRCGKEYRYVIDCSEYLRNQHHAPPTAKGESDR
jgi:hypothetical protein